MAEWRKFNATNEPETCLWCGRKLRWRMHQEWKIDQPRPVGPGTRAIKAGDYEDGYFCGLRCAYQFAVDMATRDHRLVKKEWAEQ
jgi:hypothetical protein